MKKKIKINGCTFRVSPLRCKQLRQISELLLDKENVDDSACANFDLWMPFVLESLRIEHPAITTDVLEELTLDEFNALLKQVISISGIKTISNNEENKDNQGVEWGNIYSRLCVCAGLSYREIDEMTMNEIEEVFFYLAKHPTEAEILALVYEVKPKYGSRQKQSEREFEDNFNQIPQYGGMEPLNGLPKELKENINWAEELAAKYRKAVN